MTAQERAALQAIHDHYANSSLIPNEDHVADWLSVRPAQAIGMIDALVNKGFIKLMRNPDRFGCERPIDSVTLTGEDALAHPEDY